MGLEKEIEQIFQQVLELDLERISRSAEPSYHWSSTPPVSMFVGQSPSAKRGSTIVSFVPQDYQVVKLVLNPFRIDPLDLEENLKIIRERRAKRGVESSDFEVALDSAQCSTERANRFHHAYHEYIEESGARNPIPIVPRRVQVNDQTSQVEQQIISLAGVDYVLRKYAEQRDLYESIGSPSCSPIATIDQWPEVVEIRGPEGNDQEYIRADLIKFDSNGNWNSLTLKP